jgi:hypothetical protein
MSGYDRVNSDTRHTRVCVYPDTFLDAFEKAASFAMSFYLSSTDSSQTMGLIWMELGMGDITGFFFWKF